MADTHRRDNRSEPDAPEWGEEPQNDDELLAVARRRFQEAEEYESSYRQMAMEDLEFSLGDQWPSDILKAREADQRAILTINRLPQYIHHICNDQRQNRPAIKVSPVDDTGDKDTAEVIQGIIRHIEYNSDAEDALDTAFDCAVRMGRGYYRLNIEYTDPNSFDQDIMFHRIRNPFTVYVDPHAARADYSDMQWAFIVSQISKDEFFRTYDVDGVQSDHNRWTTTGDGWIMTNATRVAEYWYIEQEEFNLVEVQRSDGQTFTADWDKMDDWERSQVIVLNKRRSISHTVKWIKMNGYQVLDRLEWPGKYIPIIPVLGEESSINNQTQLAGIVRYAKDPQRMYNYWASAETETIALSPKAPWVLAAKQIEGHENQWKAANNRNWPYLPYNPAVDDRGNPLPPPVRNTFEPATQAITNARLLAVEDLKGTLGIYDASLGARSNETTGVAIRQRQMEGYSANFHFVDNLSKSIRHTGRVLVDLMRHVYPVGRAVRMLGEDMAEKVVKAGQDFDLETGKYDIVVDSGPSFQTKRQEAAESMVDMTRAYPNLFAVGGDLLIKNLDWPGAQELADRVRKTIPPELLENSDDPETQLAAMQGMVQQMQQQLEAINAYAKQQEEKLDEVENQRDKLEVAAKYDEDKIAMEKYKADLQHEIDRMEIAIKERQLVIEAAKVEAMATRNGSDSQA